MNTNKNGLVSAYDFNNNLHLIEDGSHIISFGDIAVIKDKKSTTQWRVFGFYNGVVLVEPIDECGKNTICGLTKRRKYWKKDGKNADVSWITADENKKVELKFVCGH